MPPGALMLDLEFGILFSLGWIQETGLKQYHTVVDLGRALIFLTYLSFV